MIDPIRSRSACIGEFETLSRATAHVGGFLSGEEGYLLYLMAQYGPGCGAIVELGSFEGRSTCWLALGTKAAGREAVTAVDMFTGSPEHQKNGLVESATLVAEGTTFHAFQRNVESLQLQDCVNAITSASVDAAKTWSGGPIRLLFIDANHDYEHVSADYGAWQHHVITGGLIAFHDYVYSPDVHRFCDELLLSNPSLRARYESGSILVLEKLAEPAS